MRYYSVSFKKNLDLMYNEVSASLKEEFSGEESALDRLKEEIEGIDSVKAAEVSDGGHVIGIEAAEEDYPEVMNQVVNLYRRFDEKSIVSYDFQLNMQ